jgi:hypothetical protein
LVLYNLFVEQWDAYYMDGWQQIGNFGYAAEGTEMFPSGGLVSLHDD